MCCVCYCVADVQLLFLDVELKAEGNLLCVQYVELYLPLKVVSCNKEHMFSGIEDDDDVILQCVCCGCC